MQITIGVTKKRLEQAKELKYILFKYGDFWEWGVIVPLNFYIWPSFEITREKWLKITGEGYICKTKNRALLQGKRAKKEIENEGNILQFPFTF